MGDTFISAKVLAKNFISAYSDTTCIYDKKKNVGLRPWFLIAAVDVGYSSPFWVSFCNHSQIFF